MKHIVSLSGGIGSYFALKRVLQCQPKENVIPVFCDTLAENGDLYRFLDDIEKKFDIHIKVLCVGKTPTELCLDEKFLFNSRVAKCSYILKSRPFMQFVSQYSPDEAIIYLGIDFTESHRCQKIIENYAPYEVQFPLCEAPYLFKYEMLQELENDGIKVPEMYRQGFSHNNCDGFCFKAGLAHYRRLLEVDPVKFRQCENRERRIAEYIGKPYTILKKNGTPISLKELRETIQSNPQLSLFDCEEEGGCGCFTEFEEE